MSESEKLFRSEVIEFKKERLWGDIILAQPLSAVVVTPIIIFFLTLLVLYVSFGTFTRKETVIGYLVPEQGLVQISSQTPGTLSEVLVQPGQIVSEGEVLFRINTSQSMDDGDLVSNRMRELLMMQKQHIDDSIIRLQTNNQRKKSHLTTSKHNIIRQLEQLSRQRSLQLERLKSAQERYDTMVPLQERRLISNTDLQNQHQTLLDEKQRYEQLEHSLIAEQARLDDTLFQLNQLSSDLDEARDQLFAESRRVDQQLLQLKSEESFSIRAPSSGRISSLQAHIGQTIESNRPLVAILPLEDELMVDLFVSTRSIGFIQPGQSIRLRYDAFPYERFGLHHGVIEEVANTILAPQDVKAPFQLNQPVYRVRASLSHHSIKAFGNEFPLQAGMTLEADVLLDTRPLYQWLLKPLFSLRGTL